MSLNVLIDTAVVYLGLAHGADEDLDATEMQEIAIRLRERQPGRDPALIEHVVREAALRYAGGRERIVENAARSLKNLPERELRALLQDLRDIAHADHTLRPEELDFIERISKIWDLDSLGTS